MPCKTVTVPGPDGGGDGTTGDLPPQLQKIVDFANENPMVTVSGLGAAGFLLMRPGKGDGNNRMYMPRPQDYDRDGRRR